MKNPVEPRHAPLSIIFSFPNMIGYIRLALTALLSFMILSRLYWLIFVFLYILNLFLGLLQVCCADGFRLDSKLANIIHMVCNRTSHAIMVFACSVLYEKLSIVFYCVFLLDFGAHWYQYQT